jgi:hypothetical protein
VFTGLLAFAQPAQAGPVVDTISVSWSRSADGRLTNELLVDGASFDLPIDVDAPGSATVLRDSNALETTTSTLVFFTLDDQDESVSGLFTPLGIAGEFDGNATFGAQRTTQLLQVPEPATMLLSAPALILYAMRRRRRMA